MREVGHRRDRWPSSSVLAATVMADQPVPGPVPTAAVQVAAHSTAGEHTASRLTAEVTVCPEDTADWL